MFLLLSEQAALTAPAAETVKPVQPNVSDNWDSWAKRNGLAGVKVKKVEAWSRETEVTEGANTLLEFCKSDRTRVFQDIWFVTMFHGTEYKQNLGKVGWRIRPLRPSDPIAHVIADKDGTKVSVHFDSNAGVGHFEDVLKHRAKRAITSESQIQTQIEQGSLEQDTAVPFTSFKERFKPYANRSLLVKPTITSLVWTGLLEVSGTQKNSKHQDYYDRVVYSFVHRLEFNTLKLGAESLLFEDYTYHRKGSGSVAGRAWYALRSTAIAHNTITGRPEFAYGELGAAFGTTLLWHPGNPNPGRMWKGTVMNFGTDSLPRVFKEFWPDIKRKLPVLKNRQ